MFLYEYKHLKRDLHYLYNRIESEYKVFGKDNITTSYATITKSIIHYAVIKYIIHFAIINKAISRHVGIPVRIGSQYQLFPIKCDFIGGGPSDETAKNRGRFEHVEHVS